MKRRILNVLIALDQFLYVLVTLGHGSPDETMSAAAWRLERSGKIAGRIFRPVLDALFSPLERDHCRKSYLSEINGKHLPDDYKLKSG